MKFSIEKKELSSMTTLVYRAASHISSKNSISALSGILIEASFEKGITMTATDMEIGMVVSSQQAEIMEEGKVLIHATLFSDFIKLLPDMLITAEFDAPRNKLKVSYGKSFSYINLYSEEGYPELPVKEMEEILTLPKFRLREALKKTVFAAAGQHFRQIFTGVLFHIKSDQTVDIVASDTHRMACFTCELEQKPQKEEINFIIPARTVNELLRVMDDSDEELHIAMNQNNVIFYYDQFLMFSRLIEGQYPNYEMVIPSSFTTEFTIGANILTTALERSRIMPPDEKFKIPNIQMYIEEQGVTIDTVSENMGEIKEFLDDLHIEGNHDFKILFNTNYFLDVAKMLSQETEKIQIRMSGPLSAAAISNPEKKNYVYVLVPLRSA